MEGHMKPILSSIVAITWLDAFAFAQPTHFTVRDLGALGANPGQPFLVTNNGLISGAVGFPDGTEHAVIWYDLWKGDFGPSSLGGQNSIAFAVNERGQAVGEAETSTKD